MSVQAVERKLAAIFAADIAAYSRLMSQDEVGTLARLRDCGEVMDRLIATHGKTPIVACGCAELPSMIGQTHPVGRPFRTLDEALTISDSCDVAMRCSTVARIFLLRAESRRELAIKSAGVARVELSCAL